MKEEEGVRIIYKIENYHRIKIFGFDFVNNNKYNCKIKVKGVIKDLQEYYDIEEDSEIHDGEIKNKTTLEIMLIGINKIIDMSYMFYRCNLLLSIPDISKWNVENVTNMRCMFSDCGILTNLSGIEQ